MMSIPKHKNRKANHNKKVRHRIRASAGQAFRKHGYAASGIDVLMAGAGLTRGAFYAHYTSKDALFCDVVETDHQLIRALKRRQSMESRPLWNEMRAIFALYLNHEHLPQTYANCTLVALSNATARSTPQTRRNYETAYHAVIREMVRGQKIPPTDPNISAALTLSIGAVATAAACETSAAQAQILSTSLAVFRRLTSAARVKAEHQGTQE